MEFKKKTTQIELEQQVLKVLRLSTAFNNTFVMVRMDKPCQQESIVHFDAQGKILYEHTYDDVIDTFGQINYKEVIVLDIPKNKIDIINLQQHTIRSINHQYLFEDTAHTDIYNFAQTRIFCIQEKGTFNDNRLRLSYYFYDDLQENTKPLAVYMSKDKQWTFDHVVLKGNNHSKVIWFTYKHAEQLIFNYFDLDENLVGNLRTVRAVNTLGNEYGVNSIQLNVAAIWQTRPNVYLLFSTSNKKQLGLESKQGVYNNNFILDCSLGSQQAILRETNFVFDVTPDGFSYNDQLIDFFGVGNISVFHTFRHNNGVILQTPIYYVDNHTQKIIAKDSWTCSCYSSNYFFPGWDKNTYVQANYDNGDVKKIKVSVISFGPSNGMVSL